MDIEKWCPSLKIIKTLGMRTFWDLQQNQEKHELEEWQDEMVKLEMRVSQIDEFRNIAFFHHLVYNKIQFSRRQKIFSGKLYFCVTFPYCFTSVSIGA